MKKQSLVALFLGMAFFAFAVFANPTTTLAAGNGVKLTITVPFDFQVNDKKYEAGEYEIQRLNENLFLIRKADGEASGLVSSSIGAGNASQIKEEKIVFQRYGSKYFLREIYHQRQTSGRLLNESKSEKRARKEAAESEDNLAQKKSEKVEILAVAK